MKVLYNGLSDFKFSLGLIDSIKGNWFMKTIVPEKNWYIIINDECDDFTLYIDGQICDSSLYCFQSNLDFCLTECRELIIDKMWYRSAIEIDNINQIPAIKFEEKTEIYSEN